MTVQPDLDSYHALWIGESLPAYLAGCLASFLRLGHRVVLHSYEPVEGLPAGTETADAARVLPREKVFLHHRTRGLSAFSDHFRYRVLQDCGGTWIDTDIYLLRPISDPAPVLFAMNEPTVIGAGLLRLPPGHPLLCDLLGIFEHQPHRLPWLLPSTRRRAWLRRHLLRRPYYAVTPIGSTGPGALTWLVKRHGLEERALPTAAICPVPWEEANCFARADFDVRPLLGPETLGIHLWNDVLRHRAEPPEPGSLMARIAEEGRGGAAALTLDGI